MVCGCAIVVSNIVLVWEVIIDGEMGWLVDFFDYLVIVIIICQLLEDKEER